MRHLIRCCGLLLLQLLVIGPAWSNTRELPGVSAYYQQNILPALQLQRRKLEPLLSASDRKQVALCRASLPFAADMSPATPETRFRTVPTPTAQVRQAQQAVDGLVAKYDTIIARLLTELAPQQTQWRQDLTALLSPASDSLAAVPADSLAGHELLAGYLRPERFLLLPLAEEARPTATVPAVFPNPSRSTNQLEYTLEKAGAVTVELLDSRGTTLRTLQQEQQPKGAHTLGVDIGQLPPGTYYYKITTRTGSSTQRFLVQ